MREMAYSSTVFRYPRPIYNCDHALYVQCDNASFKHFAWSALSSLSHTIKHPQISCPGCPKITGTGRQSLLINKSFNYDILLELVFLGIQDPMFQTFLVFFKIISVISGIFVHLYQVYRIPGPPPPGRPTPFNDGLASLSTHTAHNHQNAILGRGVESEDNVIFVSIMVIAFGNIIQWFLNKYNKVVIALHVVQFWSEINLVITNRVVITRLISA
jgi:hypothetical protein